MPLAALPVVEAEAGVRTLFHPAVVEVEVAITTTIPTTTAIIIPTMTGDGDPTTIAIGGADPTMIPTTAVGEVLPMTGDAEEEAGERCTTGIATGTEKDAEEAATTTTTIAITTTTRTNRSAAAAGSSSPWWPFGPTTRSRTGPRNAAASARPVPPSSTSPRPRSSWRRRPSPPWPRIPPRRTLPGSPPDGISASSPSRRGTPAGCTLGTCPRTCTSRSSTTFSGTPLKRPAWTAETITITATATPKGAMPTRSCRFTSTTSAGSAFWSFATWP
mmetsp:Transcript_23780/g.65958  ORF Transcript_23780/g.65958 Transcript_23780/m.65958 type:complete len:274 (+) Transcript_23780:254-1075(+)